MKEKVYIREFFQLLINYRKQLAIIMGVSVLSLVSLSYILPKSYRSEFELNIYSKYFKNAFISEVIPGMNSIAEMTQTVDSMVKEVLNDDFIDEIGRKYKIYPEKMTDLELAKKRELLRENFEMFSTGGQSYKITFVHKDPLVAYEVSKNVMGAVRNYFIETRLDTIESAKRTIMKKLESVNVTKNIKDNEVYSNALAAKSPDVLKSEIIKINQDLSALKMQFNSSHPRIIKLEQRKSTILNWLSEIKNDVGDGKDFTDAPLLMASDHDISENIASKLYAKFNDINIALDIEKKSLESYIGVIQAPQIPTGPLFPKKRLFASLGFMIGLICCFAYVFFCEVMALTPAEKAKVMAAELDCEYFGILPHIDENELMSVRDLRLKSEKMEKLDDETPIILSLNQNLEEGTL